MSFDRVTIYWDTELFSGNVGSIRISRSDNGELGSYYVISTQSYNSLGSFVGSGSNDKITSWYKVQTYDGTNWSGSSLPIRPIENHLTTVNLVKKAARLNSNTDFSDYEIVNSIIEAESEISQNYGDPISRSYFVFDSSSGSTVYYFTPNRYPVYTIREVRVDGLEYPYHVGSWEFGPNQGIIKFNSSFIDTHDGENVSVDWIPQAFNTLCTLKAAVNVVNTSVVSDGETVENPYLSTLMSRIGSFEEAIRPKGVYRSTEFEMSDERDEKNIFQREFYF